jgi:hypothetical protein
LILATCVIYFILNWYLQILRGLKKGGIKAFLFRQAIKLPYVSTKIEAMCIKEENNYIAKTKALRHDTIKEIPGVGWTEE